MNQKLACPCLYNALFAKQVGYVREKLGFFCTGIGFENNAAE